MSQIGMYNCSDIQISIEQGVQVIERVFWCMFQLSHDILD
jgi:hypothetical protein